MALSPRDTGRRRGTAPARGIVGAVALRLALLAGVLVIGTLGGCELRTIVVVEVARVDVTPSVATVIEGESITLEAAARSAAGALLGGRDVVWSTLSPTRVSVDELGTVRGLAAGEAVVRATVEGVTGEATVTVLPGPSLLLDPEAVSLGAAVGESSPVATVEVRNGGNGQISGVGARVTYPPGEASGWLTASLESTAVPTALNLQASAVGLSSGEYRATVAVEADGGLSASVEVELTVTPGPPEIVADPSAVGLSAVLDGQSAPAQVVSITNGGGGTLDGLSAGVVYDIGTPGWLTADLDRDTAPTDLVLRASPAGLAVGEYRATVLISSPVADEDALVTVTFVVSAGAPIP